MPAEMMRLNTSTAPVAIGAQNVLVLRQGLSGAHVAPVVAVCTVSDWLLVALGVGGGSLGAALVESVEHGVVDGVVDLTGHGVGEDAALEVGHGVTVGTPDGAYGALECGGEQVSLLAGHGRQVDLSVAAARDHGAS